MSCRGFFLTLISRVKGFNKKMLNLPTIYLFFNITRNKMIKTIKIIAITLTCFCFIIVKSNAQKDVNITGTILNNKSFSKIYLLNMVTKAYIDSSIINSKGDFKFKSKIENIDYYQLYLNQENYVILVLLPGENILVKYDMNNKGYPVVTGSENTKLFYTSYIDLYNYDKQIDDFAAKMNKEKKDYLRKIIDDNPKSFSCLFFIYQLDIKEDFKYYKKLADGLQIYKGNILVDEFVKKVDEESFLAIGAPAPEIDMPSVKGNNIKLSSLKGKFVIIDFWSSWCKPCRAENPELVRIYKKFHDKGLEIYSVSLDQKKEDWQAAIEKDGTGSWTHVSDLKYWSSSAAVLYGVQAIPYLVLIDKKGLIILKGISIIEAEQKLEELLK
jgi:thiol-disulfide isomerase/thioredoxin